MPTPMTKARVAFPGFLEGFRGLGLRVPFWGLGFRGLRSGF